MVKFLHRESVCHFLSNIEITHIDISTFFYLDMNIRAWAFRKSFYVFIFKLASHRICFRYQEISEIERNKRQQAPRHDIRKQQSFEADAATQYRNYLRMSSHFGSEENDGDKHEQKNKQIDEIRYKRDVIMEHDLFQRCFVFHEAIDIFGHIEYDKYDYQQTYSEEEGANIFFEYIPI